MLWLAGVSLAALACPHLDQSLDLLDSLMMASVVYMAVISHKANSVSILKAESQTAKVEAVS